MDQHLCVASPPEKPLMLFDGDCHFCRRWIERWRESTAGRVDYETSQSTGDRFPEIPPANFKQAVQFIETNGRIFSGAAAVYHSLGYSRGGKWLRWSYDRVPGIAAVSDVAYRFVAAHRQTASFFSRALWGEDVRRPKYFAARRWFLHALGAIFSIAFLSVWVQVDGLMGAHGIVPVHEYLDRIRHYGSGAVFATPTLFWFNSSDGMLHILCAVGAGSGLALACGFLPVAALAICFCAYLSLISAGAPFFNFQWDILLLETAFLAMFFAPWQWRIRRGTDAAPSRLTLFLLKFLLFKIMWMSGVVKLTSGDPCWANLTALDYHYWTQPLPTVLAWFADKSPAWLKHLSVAATLFVEIVVPFFIWAPRRLRLVAAGLLVALQIAIALTGNYCFFNLLIIALCLLLIDDSSYGVGRDSVEPGARASGSTESRPTVAGGLRWAVLIVTLPLNLWQTYSAIKPAADPPRPLAWLYSRIEPFRIVNGYGLFRVMTKERPEIIIEGSANGVDWRPYEFKWKPGDVMRAPRWNAPHQPRLDWLMWFAALGSERDRACVENLVACLLRNETAVTSLMKSNPFADKAPQLIRAKLYDYRFTTGAERRATGAWWKREERGDYLPAFSLETP